MYALRVNLSRLGLPARLLPEAEKDPILQPRKDPGDNVADSAPLSSIE